MDLASHHVELRDTLRHYLEEHAPVDVVSRHDAEGTYPEDIVAGLAELGVCGLTIGEEYGGGAADGVSVAIACEEMQRAGGCIASAITPTMTFCAPGIERYGTPEQKDWLLPGLATGKIKMAIGLSEPDAGSDLSTVTMRAEPRDGGFVVSGTKVWCTGAGQADYVFALVRTDRTATGYDGLSIILLPTADERLSVRKIGKLASQGTASCEVVADRLWVPRDHIVGEVGQGGRLMLSLLDSERVFAAAQCVGMAQGAFDLALTYAQQREQFGRPIIEHQAIGHMLADMATHVAMARLLAYSAAAKADAGGEYALDAALAKLGCSEVGTTVVQWGMQVLGSYSYSVEYPMERYYRESKLFEIAGGTNQILRDVITKRLRTAL